jgi:hypothetical protein
MEFIVLILNRNKMVKILLLITSLLLGSDDKPVPVLDKNKDYDPVTAIEFEEEISIIPPETTDDVLLDKDAHIFYLSETQMLIVNEEIRDVFIFGMDGKVISRFNRRGELGYNRIGFVAYDEEADEVYVKDSYMFVI